MAVILPATLILAAAGAVLLLRTAANLRWDNSGEPADLSCPERWASAYASAKVEALRDWSGTLLLLAALFMAVVFVWMLQALFVIVPGTLILAAAAIKIRAAGRAQNREQLTTR
jgi:hypothetical protein